MKKNVFRHWITKIWRIIRMPEMQMLPGQLAFFFVLSVVPMIALLGYLGIYCSLSVDQIGEFVNQAFPAAVSKMLLPILTGKTFNTNMIVFLVSSFLLASNGAYSIILISNNLYKIKDGNDIKRRIKAINMTFVIVTLVIFTLLVPTFGHVIINMIGHITNSEVIASRVQFVFDLVKWPISLIFIYFNIKLIYTMAPDVRIRSKDVTKGALCTTILWILAANLYSSYLATFTHYDIFYGSISNVIILLLWVYLLSYIFVMGLALNVMEKEEKKEAIK